MATRRDWTELTDGELADFYMRAIDFDADGGTEQTNAIVAEVKRRGLSTAQLYAALTTLDKPDPAAVDEHDVPD